jgi:nucleotide-binding universal stress UspA family protein
MYKRILVPLDGSERAEKIFPHVLNLCEARQGKLILLLVLDSPFIVPASTVTMSPAAADRMVDVEDVLERTRSEAHAYLKRTQSALEAKGARCEILIEKGPIVERIAQVAEEKNVDLVAISSHGRTGLSRVFFGSVAAGVLHRVEDPLLIVRSVDKP